MNPAAVHLSGIRPPTGDLTGEALARYARNTHVAESEKIGEAARQFEAVLVRQILSAARKTVIRSGLEQESAATDIYRDMVNAQLAEAITGSGGLGLARSLQVQFQRPTRAVDVTQETAPEGDARSLTGFTHDGLRARHD
ncbi:MAG: rod-binding protein [Verrucomicrobiales bacterium]|nr:rod-binding protein [Verrucomicrobiales bacterium]